MTSTIRGGQWLAAMGLLGWAVSAGAQEVPPGGSEPVVHASCESQTLPESPRSYQVLLQLDESQTASFQVMEPTTFDCDNRANGAHPLMLHGPGYSSPRSQNRSSFSSYLDAGYTVISWDPRGFGDSTGTVRVMDPEFEGQYFLAILDWAEQNLDYLAWRNESTGQFVARPAGMSSEAGGENLVVGAQGGSYGGGYQLMILTVDGKQRLDAIAPDITWHDLRNALNPGDVVKTTWDLVLSAGGEANGHTTGDDFMGPDPFIKETLARGASFNEWPRQSLDWFHYRGLGYWCAAAGLPAMPYVNYGDDTVPMLDPAGSYNVPPREADGRPGFGSYLQQPVDAASHFAGLDVLITQGMIDTLFNFNEAWWNFQCLSAAGADVTLATHNTGHVLPFAQSPDKPPASNIECPLDTKGWFDARLKPNGSPQSTDEVCFALEATGDVVYVPAGDVIAPQPAGGHVAYVTRAVEPIAPVPNGVVGVAETSGNAPIHAPLGVVEADGVLAGMPRVNLTVASVAGLNEMAPQDCSDPAVPIHRTGCDSIIFVGVGKKSGMLPNYALIDDQLTPLRGLGTHEVDLVGIAERVQAGDELALVFYASHPQFPSAISRDATIPAVVISGTAGLPLYATDGSGAPVPGSAIKVLSGEELNPGDSDGDGVFDDEDSCPNTPDGEAVNAEGCSASQVDSDEDGVNDLADNCPATSNPNQDDNDSDGIGDACELSVSLAADPSSGDVTDEALTVNFTATPANVAEDAGTLSYVFYWGNGQNSGVQSSNTASHDYDQAGTYTARVVVIDERNNGASDTVAITTTTTVTVSPDPIVVDAALSIVKSSEQAPSTVTFDASGSTAPAGAIYRFDFGGGDVQEGTASSAVRTYALAGSYEVTLTVTDADDAENTDSITGSYTIGSGQQATAQLTVNPSTANIDQLVTFDASASLPSEGAEIVSYTFDFGDGSDPVTRTVADFPDDAGIASYAYDRSGSFTPSVTVTDDAQQQVTVQAKVSVRPVGGSNPGAPAASGGGGALGAALLMPMLLLGLRRRRV